MADTNLKPPAHLPKQLQKKWLDTHAAALKQAAIDMPERPNEQAAQALKEANKLVRTPEPSNYDEAKKLVDDFQNDGPNKWQIISHGIRKINGEDHLRIVTSNGHKHTFPVPAAKK